MSSRKARWSIALAGAPAVAVSTIGHGRQNPTGAEVRFRLGRDGGRILFLTLTAAEAEVLALCLLDAVGLSGDERPRVVQS